MTNFRAVGIIQARTGSTRLPNKVLLPMAGAPMLQRLIERVTGSRRLDDVMVATSEREQDTAIEELCRRIGIPVYRGSEGDVLDRFAKAAELTRADVVVRLTGDNPLVDGALVDDLLAAFLARVPPLAYAQNGDDSGFPLGLSAEAITVSALRAAMASSDPLDREHVTRFVRLRPREFPALVLKSPHPLGGVSVTVDTLSDYRRVKALFETLYDRNSRFTYHDVIDAVAPRAPAPLAETGVR